MPGDVLVTVLTATADLLGGMSSLAAGMNAEDVDEAISQLVDDFVGKLAFIDDRDGSKLRAEAALIQERTQVFITLRHNRNASVAPQ